MHLKGALCEIHVFLKCLIEVNNSVLTLLTALTLIKY